MDEFVIYQPRLDDFFVSYEYEREKCRRSRQRWSTTEESKQVDKPWRYYKNVIFLDSKIHGLGGVSGLSTPGSKPCKAILTLLTGAV
jgi:hypothetical protein